MRLADLLLWRRDRRRQLLHEVHAHLRMDADERIARTIVTA